MATMSAGLALPKIPHKLIVSPGFSDEEFEQLCFANPDVAFERNREGEIVVNAPAGFDSSSGNSQIAHQLESWWETHERGRLADSSAGFFLPDGSMMSPDAAYLTEEQTRTLKDEDLQHFLHVPPAFVIELRSQSQDFPEMTDKMNCWMANGVRLGWMVDPYRRCVHVYEQGKTPHIVTAEKVVGSGPIAGFTLDLKKVWRRYKL